MGGIVYHLGGFNADAPAQNKAEECDDSTRTVTTWDEAGNVTASRAYAAEENAAAYAAATPELITVQVDPAAIAAAVTAAQKATTVAALRSAVVAIAQQIQPS